MGRARRKKQGAFTSFAEWTEPGPARPQVTRQQVVQRALELLAQDGFDGLTMRRLAERLGIKAASLYNHVSDKNELLALIADAICAEIAEPEPARAWRQQLETLGRRVRRVLISHRDGARVLAATPPVGPNRLRLIERVLQVLLSAGFSPAEAADASFVLNSFVVGFVLDETLGEPQGAAAAKRMREQARRWFKSLPPHQYPTLVSLADELVETTPDRRFEFGVRSMMDGLELRLRRKKP
jgi:TetR/AcrR family transcriptional regulator, tetracycline repressor protein